jgi:hypothetical protein
MVMQISAKITPETSIAAGLPKVHMPMKSKK